MNMTGLCLFVSTEYTNVTDGRADRRTPREGILRAALVQCIARQKLTDNNVTIYRVTAFISFNFIHVFTLATLSLRVL